MATTGPQVSVESNCCWRNNSGITYSQPGRNRLFLTGAVIFVKLLFHLSCPQLVALDLLRNGLWKLMNKLKLPRIRLRDPMTTAFCTGMVGNRAGYSSSYGQIDPPSSSSSLRNARGHEKNLVAFINSKILGVGFPLGL
jgi:hypothetical protein